MAAVGEDGLRVRVEIMEAELQRVRDRLHELEASLAAVRYFGEKVSELSQELHGLATKVEGFTRQAIRRPTPTGVNAVGQWAAVIIALIALLVSLMHHG